MRMEWNPPIEFGNAPYFFGGCTPQTDGVFKAYY